MLCGNVGIIVLSGEVCHLHVQDCLGYGCFDLAFIASHLTKLLCFSLGTKLPTAPIRAPL